MLPAPAPQPKSKEFLTCTCGYRLARVEIHGGRTTIPLNVFGLSAYIDRAEIACPVCGQVRRFSSAPVRRKPRVGHA